MLNPETGYYTRITMRDGFINDNILSISGRGKQIWFATLGGCARLWLDEDGSFKIDEDHYSQYNNESHGISDFIYDIQLSREGTVWIATDGKGIISYENEQFKMFSQEMNLEAECYLFVDEDEKGGIWFASARHGLYHTNGMNVDQFNENNGLRSNVIHSICADQNGQIIVIFSIWA